MRTQLSGAELVASGADYGLWRPTGTPRMALFVGGLYHDGWLSPAGHLTVYPGADGRVTGTLHVPLSLPKGTRPTTLRLQGPGVDRRVTVRPGKSLVVTVQVTHRGPWTLNFKSNKIGYLQPDDRPISVQAGMPSFGGSYRGSATPSSAA